MADRKQFLGVSEADPELQELLNATKDRVASEEELREQRISFAFGNALNYESITKESVREASERVKLL